MALVLPSLACSTTSPLCSSTSSSASMAVPFPSFVAAAAAAAKHFSRLQQKGSFLKPASVNNVGFPTHLFVSGDSKVIVCASAEDTGSIDLPSEGSPTPVENLPLESKLQERLEQKLKMKLAKKIRLRRKRLVRKRRLRKKGRWPPSKMKKNKNV